MPLNRAAGCVRSGLWTIAVIASFAAASNLGSVCSARGQSSDFNSQVFSALQQLMFLDWGGRSYAMKANTWNFIGGADIGPGANSVGGGGVPTTPGVYSLTALGLAYVQNTSAVDGVVSARILINGNNYIEIDDVSVPAGAKVPVNLFQNSRYRIYGGDNIWARLDLNPSVPMFADAGPQPQGLPASVCALILWPAWEE
jgi:hypothetical protein